MVAIAKKIIDPAWSLVQSPVIKNFFIFSFGSLLRRGISLVIAPITLTILTPADYGLLALANSFISVITVFVGMGLRQSFQLDYFHCTAEQRKKLINDNIIIYLLVSTPLFMLLTLFYKKINALIFVNSASYKLIFMSLLVSFIYFFVEFFYQVLKYQCNAKKNCPAPSRNCATNRNA